MGNYKFTLCSVKQYLHVCVIVTTLYTSESIARIPFRIITKAIKVRLATCQWHVSDLPVFRHKTELWSPIAGLGGWICSTWWWSKSMTAHTVNQCLWWWKNWVWLLVMLCLPSHCGCTLLAPLYAMWLYMYGCGSDYVHSTITSTYMEPVDIGVLC